MERWGLKQPRRTPRRRGPREGRLSHADARAPPPDATIRSRPSGSRRSSSASSGRTRAQRADRQTSCAATRATHVERIAADRRARPGSTATPSRPRRRTRPPCSPPETAIAGRGGRSVRARPAARPPRAARPRDGLLPLRQRRDRGALRAGRARARACRDPRLGRPPRQRDAGDLLGRPDSLLRVAAPVAVLPGHRRAGRAERDDAQRPARAPVRATTSSSARSTSSSSPALARFEPDLLLVSAGFDAHADDPLALMRVTTDGFRRARAPLARRTRRASPRCWRAATTSRRCPCSSRRRSRGSRNEKGRLSNAGRSSSRWNCRSPLS